MKAARRNNLNALALFLVREKYIIMENNCFRCFCVCEEFTTNIGHGHKQLVYYALCVYVCVCLDARAGTFSQFCVCVCVCVCVYVCV